MFNFVQHIRHWWNTRGMYVICDARDNSVTLSRRLFRHMHVFDSDEAKVFVFRLQGGNQEYAFTLNPTLEQPSQLADIQYNTKHRCIGFETLCPTVSRIYYDYGVPAGAQVVKFSVCPALTYREDKENIAVPIVFYKILPPYARHH